MIFCASVPHVDKRTIKVLMKLGQSRPTARPSRILGQGKYINLTNKLVFLNEQIRKLSGGVGEVSLSPCQFILNHAERVLKSQHVWRRSR